MKQAFDAAAMRPANTTQPKSGTAGSDSRSVSSSRPELGSESVSSSGSRSDSNSDTSTTAAAHGLAPNAMALSVDALVQKSATAPSNGPSSVPSVAPVSEPSDGKKYIAISAYLPLCSLFFYLQPCAGLRFLLSCPIYKKGCVRP